MKNIKGRFLRKLKTISTQEIMFKEHKNHTHNILTKPEPDPNTVREEGIDHEEMRVQLPMHDVQLSLKVDTQNGPSCEGPESPSEDKCPPGGKHSVVLYTTSLRGIRKTFEDCNTIRFLLESFRVVYSERDVSMHLVYRDELWGVLGGRVVPPRLFIRGRCIGGADEAVGLHEKGMLASLLEGIPLSPSRNPCRGCGGMRFVLCRRCNGSRKVAAAEGVITSVRCHDCNENGLIKCSICS
ncbi:hypothetical protein ACS0TY_016464 [Phlomoides rotata]